MTIKRHLFLISTILYLLVYNAYAAGTKILLPSAYFEQARTTPDTLQIKKLVKQIDKLYQTNPEKALILINKQYILSSQINYTWGKANALQMKGFIYDFMQKYDKALPCYLESVRLYTAISSRLNILDVTNAIGVLYAKRGIYTESLKYLFKALTLAKQENDVKGYISTYNNIGLIYRNQHKYDKALEYYLKSIAVQKNNKVSFSISHTYLNIGEIYRLKKQPDIALNYFKLGLENAVTEKDSISIANNYSNIGTTYSDKSDYNNALHNQRTALAIREKNRDGYGMFTSLVSLADINYKTGNYATALNYSNKAFAIVKTTGELDMLAESYRQLSEINAALGNYNSAYLNYKLYKKVNDSVFNTENHRRLTEQQLNFEFEAVQKENNRKAAEALLQQKYIRNYTIAGTIIFTSLVLLYLRKRYKARQARKQKEFDEGIDILQHEIERRETEAQALKTENENIQLKSALEKEYEKNEREKLQEKLDFNRRELASATLYLFQKNQMLSELKTELETLKQGEASSENLNRIKASIQQNLYLDADWDRFKLHFEQVHSDFFKELNKNHPGLTAYEVRLYAYLHMKLSTKEIAGLLNITPASVIKAKVRLNKKLNNGKAENDKNDA